MIYVLLIILILGVIAMSIYYGNTKIGKVFFGSTAIGKVYHGSTLVFQSMKKVPVYGYSNNRYLLGSNSTSGVVFSASNRTADTITAITGTLGASGSTIKTSSTTEAFNNYYTFSYYGTLTFNGVKIYMYSYTETGVFYVEYVIEDARVGSACLHDITVLFDGNPDIHPSSVTSSGMTRRGGATFTRVASNDGNYTKNGLTN